jgi:subtilisin family serine protease
VVSGAEAAELVADVVEDDAVDLVGVEPVKVVRAVGEVRSAVGDPLRGVQWGLDQVAFESVWPCSKGAGMTIAVVDTGVDSSHEDFEGRVLPGASKLGLGPLVAGDGGTDPNGHGTHVAGIAAAGDHNGVGIIGVAPDATVLPVRALGSSGSGYDADVAAGVTWAVDQGADVINLSLGSPAPSTAMAAAVAYAADAGVPVIAAMGNSGDGGALQWPAVDDTTIAVSSFASGGQISQFSTSGLHADVAAPGSSVAATLPGGVYGYKSGTSMATPHVAGLVAIMRAVRGSDDVGAIRDRLCSTARDAGAVGIDARYGCGIVDPVAAVR